jgi:hypothetical protein
VNIGDPVAQITMMFNHMVEKRKWLTKDRFVKIIGVIAVVSLDLIPEAIVSWLSFVISMVGFLLIVLLKRDVALVAVPAMVGGIGYALGRGSGYGS